MPTMADLLSEIDAFCREARIAEATFGTRAAKDGKFVKRLRAGAGVTIATVERVRAYMAEQRKITDDARSERPAQGEAA